MTHWKVAVFAVLMLLLLAAPAFGQSDNDILSLTAADGKYQVDIERIWSAKSASGRTPTRDAFLILEITLYNHDSEEACFYGWEFPADARGRDLNPDNLRQVRDEFYPERDYPGSTNGQCIPAKGSAPSFLAYDIPPDLESITIVFKLEGTFTLDLTPLEDGEYGFALADTDDVVALTVSANLAATPTATPASVAEVEPSSTSPAVSALSNPITTVRGNEVNSRACPSTDCAVVKVLSSTDEIILLGKADNWYWVQLSDGKTAYIRGDLLNIPADVEIGIAPTITPSPAASPTRLPSPTQVSVEFDEETLTLLVETALSLNDIPVRSVERQGTTLLVIVNNDFEGEADVFFASVMGAVAGSVVGAYEGEGVSVAPPRIVLIEFKSGSTHLASVEFDYTDANDYIAGDLTAIEFLGLIRVVD